MYSVVYVYKVSTFPNTHCTHSKKDESSALHIVHFTTVGDLCHYINGKLNRSEEAPMFIYANNEVVVSKDSIVAEVYQEYREDDFFLYLGYYEENIHADIARDS